MKVSHGHDHMSRDGMQAGIVRQWFTKGFTNYSKKLCLKCLVAPFTMLIEASKCLSALTHQLTNPLVIHRLILTLSERKKYCLVIVNVFSEWFEAFSTAKNDVRVVAKEIMPR